MSRGPNAVRRRDIEAALRRAKPEDYLRLDQLAIIWGTTKTNFVNVKALMPEFPAPIAGPKNAHLYPARAALKVMLAYEKRNDKVAADLEGRFSRIMGRTPAKGGRGKAAREPEPMLPLNDLATASRVMAETEQRERDMGLYCPLADQASTAGLVFGMFSDFLSNLSTQVDPNGVLAPEVHAFLKIRGTELSLQMHGEMRDMLSGDAKPRSSGNKGSRGANGRAGGSRSRRPRR